MRENSYGAGKNGANRLKEKEQKWWRNKAKLGERVSEWQAVIKKKGESRVKERRWADEASLLQGRAGCRQPRC